MPHAVGLFRPAQLVLAPPYGARPEKSCTVGPIERGPLRETAERCIAAATGRVEFRKADERAAPSYRSVGIATPCVLRMIRKNNNASC